jgi:hypothetical protein
MTAGQPNAIKIIQPDPDSHYRLVPCLCGCSKTTYAKYPLMWRVYCPACGEAVDGEPGQSQHDVQVIWNTKKRGGKTP